MIPVDISAAHVLLVVAIMAIGFCAGWIARGRSEPEDGQPWM